MAKVEDAMRQDRRLTVRERALLLLDIPNTLIQDTVIEKLRYRKVYAKHADGEHKRPHIIASREFFDRYAQEEDNLFNSIVTSDERWAITSHLKQKYKKRSFRWQYSNS